MLSMDSSQVLDLLVEMQQLYGHRGCVISRDTKVSHLFYHPSNLREREDITSRPAIDLAGIPFVRMVSGHKCHLVILERSRWKLGFDLFGCDHVCVWEVDENGESRHIIDFNIQHVATWRNSSKSGCHWNRV